MRENNNVSENNNHNRTNRINWYVYENMTTRVCLPGLDARKFKSAKIYMFTILTNTNHIQPAHVGHNLGTLSNARKKRKFWGSRRSARVFGYQLVGIGNAKCWCWGSKLTRRPNATGFAFWWNIGFLV